MWSGHRLLRKILRARFRFPLSLFVLESFFLIESGETLQIVCERVNSKFLVQLWKSWLEFLGSFPTRAFYAGFIVKPHKSRHVPEWSTRIGARQPATLSNISTVGAQEMQKRAGVLSCQSSLPKFQISEGEAAGAA